VNSGQTDSTSPTSDQSTYDGHEHLNYLNAVGNSQISGQDRIIILF